MNIDSLILGYNTSSADTTGAYIDAVTLFQSNRTSGTNLSDSSCFTDATDRMNTTAGTRLALYVNRQTLPAGHRLFFLVKVRFKAANSVARFYYVQLKGKRY
jgi:hypothetical protein